MSSSILSRQITTDFEENSTESLQEMADEQFTPFFNTRSHILEQENIKLTEELAKTKEQLAHAQSQLKFHKELKSHINESHNHTILLLQQENEKLKKELFQKKRPAGELNNSRTSDSSANKKPRLPEKINLSSSSSSSTTNNNTFFNHQQTPLVNVNLDVLSALMNPEKQRHMSLLLQGK